VSVVVITGDHPRHIHFATELHRSGQLSGWIIERRSPFLPTPPESLSRSLADLFNTHFRRRAEAEKRFFGETAPDSVDVGQLRVEGAGLNAKPTATFIRSARPRLVISYGCHKLSDELIQTTGPTFWNVHGGLSPWYRGVATHFWPSYMLEPQMTGVTLHETTSAIDGGSIIHQTGVDLVRGDGLHDLAARAVKTFVEALPSILTATLAGDALPTGRPLRTSGRIWTGNDWRPEHLRPIYEIFGDRVVDAVLDGTITGRQPQLMKLSSLC
jgi:hypothetical protein